MDLKGCFDIAVSKRRHSSFSMKLRYQWFKICFCIITTFWFLVTGHRTMKLRYMRLRHLSCTCQSEYSTCAWEQKKDCKRYLFCSLTDTLRFATDTAAAVYGSGTIKSENALVLLIRGSFLVAGCSLYAPRRCGCGPNYKKQSVFHCDAHMSGIVVARHESDWPGVHADVLKYVVIWLECSWYRKSFFPLPPLEIGDLSMIWGIWTNHQTWNRVVKCSTVHILERCVVLSCWQL